MGGGAAGMIAAIGAAESLAGDGRVVLLEGNEQLGRKILVSGNGRCNLANLDGDNPGHYHGGNPRFVRPALEAFPTADALVLFEELGIQTHVEKRGRLFPRSDQARSVVAVLEDRLRQVGVEIVTGIRVEQLESGPDGFHVGAGDGRRWEAERVIMCSGGVSVPKLGADDSGMRLVESLGHRRTPLYPGLVALESHDPWVRRAQGLKVSARVAAPCGRSTIVDTDDLLFTKYGVSGFTILNLSARLVRHLRETGPLTLSVSLLPQHTAEQVSELLQARWSQNPHRGLLLSFAGLLHDKLVRALLGKLGFDPEQPVAAVTKRQRWELAQVLTDWQIEVTGPRDFEHAEVTIGGIDTAEVDPHSLESYLVPGLYFAGEILDVHADLGGFNFQWAWSSGHLAGRETAG